MTKMKTGSGMVDLLVYVAIALCTISSDVFAQQVKLFF